MRLEALLEHDGLAAIAGDQRLDYADLRAAANAGPSLVAGQRVAVIAPNVAGLVTALFTVWQACAVAVPISARAREHELRRILADSGAVDRLGVGEYGGYSFADAVGALPERAEPVDAEVAAILYTSGSTGAAKGAYLTHAAALHWGRTLAELLALRPEDRTALVIPGTHAFGLAALLAVFVSGGSVVLVDQARSVEPLARAIEAHGATVVHGSPAVFAALLESEPECLRGVRTGLVGGAASPPGLIARMDAAGVRILNVFGMTELGAASAVRASDPDAMRYETAGRALPGYALRIVDGELQVRGESVTHGYHGRPDLTEAAFDGDWFRTGDMGSIDAGGWLRVSGRAGELIHVGGFNVFPAEVEGFLLTHPDVAQAAVVGTPHPRMGEVVKAFVVPRAGCELTSGALLRFARGRIAGYKIPYGVEIVAELPRLPDGKVDKRALR